MPFDSEGKFRRVHNWEDDRINDYDIVSDRHDEEDDNFAEGLSQCFLKNGLSKMTGNFDAGLFKICNLANAQGNLDAVNKSQLDSVNSAQTTALNNFKNKFQVVSALPSSPDADTFYFIKA
ncbi:MAG: hypothetical protein IJ545_02070 [Alphaproteobacteria bacterium]|nr:hypothetical protein [Alphaproteobacteria bacterium]